MNENILNLIEELDLTQTNPELLEMLKSSSDDDFIFHENGDISFYDGGKSGITSSRSDAPAGYVLIFENIQKETEKKMKAGMILTKKMLDCAAIKANGVALIYYGGNWIEIGEDEVLAERMIELREPRNGSDYWDFTETSYKGHPHLAPDGEIYWWHRPDLAEKMGFKFREIYTDARKCNDDELWIFATYGYNEQMSTYRFSKSGVNNPKLYGRYDIGNSARNPQCPKMISPVSPRENEYKVFFGDRKGCLRINETHRIKASSVEEALQWAFENRNKRGHIFGIDDENKIVWTPVHWRERENWEKYYK